MKSVIILLLITCYISLRVHGVPIVGAERASNRNDMLPPVETRNRWGKLDSNNYWSTNHNRFSNGARQFIFPDEYERLRFRQIMTNNFPVSPWRSPFRRRQNMFGGWSQVGRQEQARAIPAALPKMSPQYYRCMDGCLSTNEYNPVCGTDGMTYPNRQRLGCASRCGKNVRFQRLGSCEPFLPVLCANNPNCRRS